MTIAKYYEQFVSAPLVREYKQENGTVSIEFLPDNKYWLTGTQIPKTVIYWLVKVFSLKPNAKQVIFLFSFGKFGEPPTKQLPLAFTREQAELEFGELKQYLDKVKFRTEIFENRIYNREYIDGFLAKYFETVKP